MLDLLPSNIVEVAEKSDFRPWTPSVSDEQELQAVSTRDC